MVTAAEIKERLDAQPFVPFTIMTIRTGEYRVVDPSHVLVTRTKLYVAQDHGPDGVPEDATQIPLKQIAKIEA